MRRSRTPVVTLVTAVLTLGLATACAPGFPGWPPDGPGEPPDEPVVVLAEGLEAPFGIDADHRKVLVAENGADQITAVSLPDGSTSAAVGGLRSPAGVADAGRELAIVTSGSDVPDASLTGDASIFAAGRDGTAELVADLEAYELAENPDGQPQFDDEGVPLDALSNPFAVIARKGGGHGHGGHDADAERSGSKERGWALVADGGANAVLAVTRGGQVSTFFVPPTIADGACEGRPNNDPAVPGCDSVPTGLAYGPDGSLYVSTLNGEAPGEGRVYVLDPRTAEIRDVIGGFTSPTGVAVREDGTVYVSEALHGAPEGEGPPPADFDPADVGRIVRVDTGGARSYAAVTMPVGLSIHHGRLYSTAWSLAGFFGMTAMGQIVRVDDSAFS